MTKNHNKSFGGLPVLLSRSRLISRQRPEQHIHLMHIAPRFIDAMNVVGIIRSYFEISFGHILRFYTGVFIASMRITEFFENSTRNKFSCRWGQTMGGKQWGTVPLRFKGEGFILTGDRPLRLCFTRHEMRQEAGSPRCKRCRARAANGNSATWLVSAPHPP